jgi:hypothetical protein
MSPPAMSWRSLPVALAERLRSDSHRIRRGSAVAVEARQLDARNNGSSFRELCNTGCPATFVALGRQLQARQCFIAVVTARGKE